MGHIETFGMSRDLEEAAGDAYNGLAQVRSQLDVLTRGGSIKAIDKALEPVYRVLDNLPTQNKLGTTFVTLDDERDKKDINFVRSLVLPHMGSMPREVMEMNPHFLTLLANAYCGGFIDRKLFSEETVLEHALAEAVDLIRVVYFRRPMKHR